jgi:hypothetical protein
MANRALTINQILRNLERRSENVNRRAIARECNDRIEIELSARIATEEYLRGDTQHEQLQSKRGLAEAFRQQRVETIIADQLHSRCPTFPRREKHAEERIGRRSLH